MILNKSKALVQTFPHIFGQGGAADTAVLNTNLESLAEAVSAITVLQAAPSGGVSGRLLVTQSVLQTFVPGGVSDITNYGFQATQGTPPPVSVNLTTGVVTLSAVGLYFVNVQAHGSWSAGTVATELLTIFPSIFNGDDDILPSPVGGTPLQFFYNGVFLVPSLTGSLPLTFTLKVNNRGASNALLAVDALNIIKVV